MRITADPGGRVFTVERDLVFVVKLTSLAMLESWLRENGLTFAELEED